MPYLRLVRSIRGVASALLVAVTVVILGAGPGLAQDGAPPWILPASLPYVGSPGGAFAAPDSTGSHLGRLDGTGLDRLGTGTLEATVLTRDGRVVAIETGTGDAGSSLVVYDGGQRVVLLQRPAAGFTLDATAEDVYVWPVRQDGSLGWLRRIPLDGSTPERILPPRVTAGQVVVSPDERSVASAPATRRSPERILARFDGGQVVRLFRGYPLGFDAAGRLIAYDLRRIVRYDHASRSVEPIPGLRARDRGSLVTPDGRWLVVPPRGTGTLVVDLVNGGQHTLPLSSADGWTLLRSFPGDLVIFERVRYEDRLIVLEHGVADILGGWVSTVPWPADEASAVGGE